jgi:hypothetical protein
MLFLVESKLFANANGPRLLLRNSLPSDRTFLRSSLGERHLEYPSKASSSCCCSRRDFKSLGSSFAAVSTVLLSVTTRSRTNDDDVLRTPRAEGPIVVDTVINPNAVFLSGDDEEEDKSAVTVTAIISDMGRQRQQLEQQDLPALVARDEGSAAAAAGESFLLLFIIVAFEAVHSISSKTRCRGKPKMQEEREE